MQLVDQPLADGGKNFAMFTCLDGRRPPFISALADLGSKRHRPQERHSQPRRRLCAATVGEDLVAELARVIRPGGWLIVTTPNVVHLTYRIRTLTGHPPKQEGYHYRFFTRKTLTATLAEAGFELDGYASFGKQVVLSKLARLAGKGAKYKVRYVVPRPFEGLLAQHFVWRLRRKG